MAGTEDDEFRNDPGEEATQLVDDTVREVDCPDA